MKQVIVSPPPVRLNMNRLAPGGLWASVAWLFRFQAARWSRRARFYDRYQEYFPRLSSGRFVERCRELESLYGRLASLMLEMPLQGQWVPVRAAVAKGRYGRRTVASHRPAVI